MSIDLGTDISTPTALDIDPSFATVSGATCLAQALARRLVTPRGTLLDDAGYGTDLRSYLNDSRTSTTRVRAAVQAELMADERVDSAVASATFASGRLTITVRVTSSGGTFTLVLAVSAVTVELLRVEPS